MSTQAPACPRCGYDQSGAVAAWVDACPLEGRCSECGLGFAWRDVLDPRHIVPGWSFEHGRWPSPFRWAATQARALNPWRFWQRLRIELPVRVPRLVLSIAAALVVLHLCVAGATVWRGYQAAAGQMAAPPARFSARRAPVPPPSPLQVLTTYRESLLGLAIWPFGTTVVKCSPTTPGFGWQAAHFTPVPGLWLIFLVSLAAGIPPGFLALGETFRRCRVRPMHLVRGLAYSMAGVMLAVGIAVGVACTGLDVGPFAAVAAAVWLCAYWVVFVRGYLRLTHGLGVAAAMLLIGGLTAALATVLAWSYWMRPMGWYL